MQMRKKISVTSLHLSQNGIFVFEVPDISPHGKILNEHLKKIIVVDGVLEFREFLFPQGSFAQQSPLNIILEAQFIRRRFTSISGNGFSKALFVAFGSNAVTLDATAGEGDTGFVFIRIIHSVGAFKIVEFPGSFQVFLFVGMFVAKWQRVVAIGLCRVVEWPNLIHDDVNGIMLVVLSPGFLPSVLFFEESPVSDVEGAAQEEEGG
mmetsp:Transcript_17568/g.36747  ORF Transcript_17568/g.36747 Transcript_17568/m.36747 type:complete len:207 (-) Transcript_17568:153-773(-)